MGEGKIRGILLDVDSALNERNETEIRLFLKTGKGVEVVHDRSLKPYFYVIAEGDIEKVKKEILGKVFGEGARARDATEVKMESEEKVLKVGFSNTKDLVEARDGIRAVAGVKGIREYDIVFARRYLIDKGFEPMGNIEVEFDEEGNNGRSGSETKEIKGEESGENTGRKQGIKRILKEARNLGGKVEGLDIACFDLETYSSAGFSNAARDAIIMISYADSDESVVFTTKEKLKGRKGVEVYGSEKEMILALLRKIGEKNPGVVVTYNGDGFDFPYLKERARQFGIQLPFSSDGSEPLLRERGRDSEAKLKGRQHVDAFRLVMFLSRFGGMNLVKYDLESVVKAMFGKEKDKVKFDEINKIWDSGEGLERLVDYNREDAEYTLRIAKEHMPLMISLCRLARLTLHEVSRASASVLIEALLMNKAFERKRLVPNRPSDEEVRQRMLQLYQGGYVKEPVPGLHDNIAVLDFSSLYPTVIISHNISPECINCECCKGKSEHAAPEGGYFCMKEKGFIPSVLSEILEQRLKMKKELKKMEKGSLEYEIAYAKQNSFKIVLNATYGYLAYARSRWYSRECAKAITSYARHYVKMAIEEAEKAGFGAIYGDTDSAFIKIPEGKGEKDVEEFVKGINDKLPGIMQLEIDGFYKRGIFVTKRGGEEAAKKRYALIDGKGNLKIVGFEYVRRDWSVIAKETQKKVIEAVLKEGRVEKAVKIVQDELKRLKDGKVPKQELVVYTQIRRQLKDYAAIGPHIAAMQKAQKRGKKVVVGGIIGYIITRSGKSISDKAELEEYVKEGNYDADYYIENQIVPAVIKIIGELGYSKEDLVAGGKQQKLGSW